MINSSQEQKRGRLHLQRFKKKKIYEKIINNRQYRHKERNNAITGGWYLLSTTLFNILKWHRVQEVVSAAKADCFGSQGRLFRQPRPAMWSPISKSPRNSQNTRSPAKVTGHLESSKTSQDTRSPANVTGHLESSKTSQDTKSPAKVTGHLESNKTSQDTRSPAKVTGHVESSKTSQDIWSPAKHHGTPRVQQNIMGH